MSLKKLFYGWAYLDIEHTLDKEKTYFGRCSEEISVKNLNTIRSLSIFFMIISVFVIISTYTFFDAFILRVLYAGIFVLEGGMFALSVFLLKTMKFRRLYNLFSSVYLLHVLAFGAYIGTVLSPDESAPVFLVVLVISQMLFILPPIQTTVFAALATLGTLITSYFIKSSYFFQSDMINCIGVFILSILLGWMVNKIRAEEAFARFQALELNDRLQHLSVTDQLTALPNHRSFQDTYYELYKASQMTGTRIGIIMMDIDKFKLYNDNYGHIMGDECLASIGLVFSKRQRENITVYRFGGEEFIALLKESACDRAAEIAREFCLDVEELMIAHRFSTTKNVVTISVGFHVGVPVKEEAPTSFIDKADRAMYQSKADGGNRVSEFKTDNM